MRQLAAAAGDGPLGFAGSPGQLETSLNSGYIVGPCNSYLEGPTLFLGVAARSHLTSPSHRAACICRRSPPRDVAPLRPRPSRPRCICRNLG